MTAHYAAFQGVMLIEGMIAVPSTVPPQEWLAHVLRVLSERFPIEPKAMAIAWKA